MRHNYFVTINMWVIFRIEKQHRIAELINKYLLYGQIICSYIEKHLKTQKFRDFIFVSDFSVNYSNQVEQVFDMEDIELSTNITGKHRYKAIWEPLQY